MKCVYCNNKLDRKWNFCPKCGRRVEKGVGLFDFFSKIFSNDYEPRKAHEITINLTGAPEEPMLSVKPSKNKPYQKKMKILNRKFSGDVTEPNTKIKNLGHKIIATLNIPGVKSVRDIQINRIYNSSEIRAFGKK